MWQKLVAENETSKPKIKLEKAMISIEQRF